MLVDHPASFRNSTSLPRNKPSGKEKISNRINKNLSNRPIRQAVMYTFLKPVCCNLPIQPIRKIRVNLSKAGLCVSFVSPNTFFLYLQGVNRKLGAQGQGIPKGGFLPVLRVTNCLRQRRLPASYSKD